MSVLALLINVPVLYWSLDGSAIHFSIFSECFLDVNTADTNWAHQVDQPGAANHTWLLDTDTEHFTL